MACRALLKPKKTAMRFILSNPMDETEAERHLKKSEKFVAVIYNLINDETLRLSERGGTNVQTWKSCHRLYFGADSQTNVILFLFREHHTTPSGTRTKYAMCLLGSQTLPVSGVGKFSRGKT